MTTRSMPQGDTEPGKPGDRSPAPKVKQERKHRLLAQGAPSVTRSIVEAVVIKSTNLFFLTGPGGMVPLHGAHGLGLYYHDCRYLNGYELKLGNTDPTTLVASSPSGQRVVFELTNADIHLKAGVIHKENIGVTWERLVDGTQGLLFDRLVFKNLSQQDLELPISLHFAAGFEDVFTVRALLDERPGRLEAPRWQGNTLALAYAGADRVLRRLLIQFSGQPQHKHGRAAYYRLALAARGSQELAVTLAVREDGVDPSATLPARPRSSDHPTRPAKARARARLGATEERQEAIGPGWGYPPGPEAAALNLVAQAAAALPSWHETFSQVSSSSALLNSLVERSIVDLDMLQSEIGHETFFAAGLPWFGTLFGRDSLITALQTLAYDPQIAEQTLRLLAARQGRRVDAWRDEQPGKILHELRVGELAQLGEIPHTPYYGTVDATPLFLILLAEHAQWTGSLATFADLRDNVERALSWMDEYGDLDGDGYLEYFGQSDKGLINQGWKDSGTSIVNQDGSLARAPIALVEVQAYAYRARLGIADLFERSGQAERAARLRQQSAALRGQFNRDYWSEDLGCYILALQAEKQPAQVAASNAGHALWAGIADDEKGQRTATRLMAPDLFGGWGIRTLSTMARAYNPIGYHLGTVWPHDNGLIAAGLRRYGCDWDAMQVITAVMEAAAHFDLYRLPELYAGFARETYGVPVRYPVACHPQAWAAGCALHMLQVCLGLQGRAFEQRLIVRQPMLPEFVDTLEVSGLRVGQARAHLRFARREGVWATAEVVGVEGQLKVEVE
jgi:glycogen debranching enzyme